MNAIHTYRKTWLAWSSFQIAAHESTLDFGKDPLALPAILLLESGRLTPLGLRKAKFLFDLSGQANDAPLGLFLLLLVAEEQAGSTVLPNNEAELIQVALQNLHEARGIIQMREEKNAPPLVQREQIQDLLRQFLYNVRKNTYANLISGKAEQVIALSKNHFSLQIHQQAEKSIQNLLRERLKPLEIHPEKTLAIQSALQSVLHQYSLKRGDSKLKLHYRQELAVALSTLTQTLLITGGPGTGKTSVVVSILRTLLRTNSHLDMESIALAAPTGQAAARLRESVMSAAGGLESWLAECTDPQEIQELQKDVELCSLEGQTIHRLLGSNRQGEFSFGKNRKLPYKIVVIDEASMIDLQLFAALLEALSTDTVLILMGDRFQLPSVGSGAVLGDLSGEFQSGSKGSLSAANCDTLCELVNTDLSQQEKESLIFSGQHPLLDHVLVLSKSHRSEQSIQDLTDLVNTGSKEAARAACQSLQEAVLDLSTESLPTLNKVNGKIYCLPVGARQVIARGKDEKESFSVAMQKWGEDQYLGKELTAEVDLKYSYQENLKTLQNQMENAFFSSKKLPTGMLDPKAPYTPTALACCRQLEQCRILCATREGPCGVSAANRILIQKLGTKLSGKKKAGDIFHGLLIMINKNDKSVNLFNGDTGVVFEVFDQFYCLFPRPAGVEVLTLHSLPSWEPAFASTIHKSQGSEYDYVLMPLPPAGHPLLTREILYTGMTRAKYFVGVMGSMEAFSGGVQKGMERRSGL